MDITEEFKPDSHHKNKKKKSRNTKVAVECINSDFQSNQSVGGNDLEVVTKSNSSKKTQKKKQGDTIVQKTKKGGKTGQTKGSAPVNNKNKDKTHRKNPQRVEEKTKDNVQKDVNVSNSAEDNQKKSSQVIKKKDTISKKKKKSNKSTKPSVSSDEKDLDVQKEPKQKEKLLKKQKKASGKQGERVGNEKEGEIIESCVNTSVTSEQITDSKIVSKSKKRRNRKKRVLETLGTLVTRVGQKKLQLNDSSIEEKEGAEADSQSSVEPEQSLADNTVPNKGEKEELNDNVEKSEKLQKSISGTEVGTECTEKCTVEENFEEKTSENIVSLPDFVPRLDQLLQDSSCSSESSACEKLNDRTSALEVEGSSSFLDNNIDSDLSSDNPDFEDITAQLTSRKEDTFVDRVSITDFLSHDNVEGLFRSALLNDITLSSRCSEKEVKNFFNTYGTFSEKNRTQFAEVEKLLLSNGKCDDPSTLQLFQPEKTVNKESQEKSSVNVDSSFFQSNVDDTNDICTSVKFGESSLKLPDNISENSGNSLCASSSIARTTANHYSIPEEESAERFPLSKSLATGLIYTSPNTESKLTSSTNSVNIDCEPKVSCIPARDLNVSNRRVTSDKSESRLLDIVENVLFARGRVREQLTSEKSTSETLCCTSDASVEVRKHIEEKQIACDNKCSSPVKKSVRNINCVFSETQGTSVVEVECDSLLEGNSLSDVPLSASVSENIIQKIHPVESDSKLAEMKSTEKSKTVKDQRKKKTDRLAQSASASNDVNSSASKISNSPSHSSKSEKAIKLESQETASELLSTSQAENRKECPEVTGKTDDHVGTRPLTPGGDMSILKDLKIEKSREDIKAEREARKAAKLARKTKAGSKKDTDTTNHDLEVSSSTTPQRMCDAIDGTVNTVQHNAASRVCDTVDGAVHIKQHAISKGFDSAVVEKSPSKQTSSVLTELPDNDRSIGKVEKLSDLCNEVSSASKVEQSLKDVKEELGNQLAAKSKAELKAERRAKQEAQRAAKALLQQQIKEKDDTPRPQEKPIQVRLSEATTKIVKTVKISETGKDVSKPMVQRKVKLFNHLYVKQEATVPRSISATSHLHPAIIRLGVQYASKVVVGSNARCLALLNAMKQVIEDYKTPPQKEFSRGLEAILQPNTAFLQECRPLSVSMTNALRHLKWQMRHLPNNITDVDAKKKLQDAIKTYIQEQIEVAGQAICNTVLEKISNGDVILTYSCSSLIQRILIEAHKSGKKFRVIVVDGRPWKEGKEMLRRLVQNGLHCSYVVITAASFIMREATQVLLGAHALLANGYVMSRVGASEIALLAHSYNVPVLVCCETHKFSERVQTDSIVYNELGAPDELVMTDSCSKEHPLSKWKNVSNLTPLNITYDVTPPDLVTAVVTELAILPCTSVPVILRIKPTEIGC